MITPAASWHLLSCTKQEDINRWFLSIPFQLPQIIPCCLIWPRCFQEEYCYVLLVKKISHLKQHIVESNWIWKQSAGLQLSRSHQMCVPRGYLFYFKNYSAPKSSVATLKGQPHKWSQNEWFFIHKEPFEVPSKLKAHIHTGNHTSRALFYEFLQILHGVIDGLNVRTSLNSASRHTAEISPYQFNSKGIHKETRCSSWNSE